MLMRSTSKVLPVSTFICVVTCLWESVSGRVKLNKWMYTHVKWKPLLFVLSLIINFHSFSFICAGKTNKSVTFNFIVRPVSWYGILIFFQFVCTTYKNMYKIYFRTIKILIKPFWKESHNIELIDNGSAGSYSGSTRYI